MINLSTSTAAHAYACRTGGSGMVVGRNVPNSRGIHSLRPFVGNVAVADTDSAIETADGLEMISHGYGSINGFRHNRFQYEIPTVGQHYGNAFHLAEDDEELRDFIVERHHYGTDVHNLMEEHIVEDDDEEEDIEMSTAVEVISIDPNCDYDTDEEDDDVEEDVKYENETENERVQEYENGEEYEESEKDSYQAQTSALQTVARNVTVAVDAVNAVIGCSQEVNEMCSDYVAGIHCPTEDEQLEAADRSRSRNCSNTDSSSTSSSSRDSSTSSSNSEAISFVKAKSKEVAFVSPNRQTEERTKDLAMHQCRQYSYHSEDGEEDGETEEEDEDEDDDPDLDFSPTKNTLWELPAKLLQDKSGTKKSKTQPHGRRKRCSSSQRQSFSMPHSPVGAGKTDNRGVIGGLLPTSLSFDDLDSLVCDLSPMKNLPIDKASTNDTEEEDLLVDPLVDAANFDLTAYITGDDTIGCDTNSKRLTVESRHQKRGTVQCIVEPAQSPVRVLPKSRGKELKVLRQHMLPREYQHSFIAPEETEPTSNGKRDSATKAGRKLTMDDESSEAEDEHTVIAQANNKSAEYRNRGTKRKVVDDTDKDPTWNPNGGGVSKSKPENKLSNQKQSASVGLGMNANLSVSNATNKHLVGSSHCNSSEEGEKVFSQPTVTVKKGTKFGQVIKTETSSTKGQVLGLPKKSHSNATVKPASAKVERHDHQIHTNVHRKKTNVKLDHDYCSSKRSTLIHSATGGNVVSSLGLTSGQQRKTIEIPFLLPTKEQLRQERKLQKEKKRSEQLMAAKKHLPQSDVSPTSYDNGKDKQVQEYQSCNGKGSVSVASKAQKIGTSLSGPLSNAEHLLSTFERKRTDVNKTCVNKITTGSSSGSSNANDVSQLDARVVEVKKNSAPPNGIGGSVKRQISLLKINQPAAAVTIPTESGGITSHVSISTQVKIDETISSFTAATLNEKISRQCVTAGSQQQEVVVTGNTGLTTLSEEAKNKHEVVVRKKLNLQEYKKRREHPESAPEGVPKATNSTHQQKIIDNRSNGSSANSTNGYSNSKVPALNDAVISKPEQTISKSDTQNSKAAVTITEPLDPISAAKMKALRMQQLKKEAAIKSNEVKLSQKTIPLMPILPLEQITSLEFDEHGNPLPLDEAKVRQRVEGDGVQDALKLHPDYEEIIIVSIGCNTSLTITPSENDTQTSTELVQVSCQLDQRQQQHNSKHATGCENEASRLLNISDTIKRCCPSVDTMPGSSLIASIQEVMIKKSNISTSIHGTVATGATQTAPVGSEASIAEGAVSLKAETMSNATVTENNAVGGGAARDHQYVLHQSSPYVGVSPPSSFSPGKPERAHTTNTRPAVDNIMSSPSKQIRTSKTSVNGTQMHSLSGSIATQTELDTNATSVVEHGEDKIIMHLRKDRVRAQRTDAATQTDSCGRFPPLCKLSPPRVSAKEQKQRVDNSQESIVEKQRAQHKRTERRSYRRHHYRNGSESPSAADSDAADRPSSRSKSHQERQRARDRHSHSHSRSRSRHRSSRRRSSCSSGSRSRSRSDYSRVHHHHRSHQHGSNGTSGSGCNNTSRYSRSRRKSRTCSRSSSSTSSSRYGSRGRRSLSSSSSTSSMSSSGSSDGGHGAVHSSRSRSRSPRRSRSRSDIRSSTPDRHRYNSREHLNHRRAISPERKIVYVGRLESTARKVDLQQKFQPYGKIVKITLHLKANGSRYGFVTFEKPQHAYDAIDACGTDPNLRNYDVSFGGRRAFCRTQYADLDGEVSNDHDHQMPYVTVEGALLLPSRGPTPYSGPALCHKEPTYGSGGLTGGGMTESFDDLLKKFKKEIGARKT
ncbi:serine-rich adhesin for platelets [Anopheles funestus]|uniref:serine-rich adhesin for platelets n=1 Tax=Anopheles funestus TaxID=62324 RepID=UPI0020C61868|nr:serine-rich adhesin for platelets [Anopheles funestus]